MKDFEYQSKDVIFDASFVKWESPSNIALIKYWGKSDGQIPANPSISLTLKNAKTRTKLSYKPSNSLKFTCWVGGVRQVDFEPKLQTFFQRILLYCPYLNHLELKIETENTFPHSSGIASSASGMSAMALCVMSIERKLNREMSDEYFYKKASFLARLGSGSASRSLYGGLVVWGETSALKDSKNQYAVPFVEAHPVFQSYQDAILLIDKGEKKVSSTVGHGLMNNHPYAENRFKQAKDNMGECLEILKNGDVKAFTKLVESEALTLHAMMMTSSPYFVLMKPGTLAVMERVFEKRIQDNLDMAITLDAGANVHLLYPKSQKQAVELFIQKDLTPYLQGGSYILDEVGKGPLKIK